MNDTPYFPDTIRVDDVTGFPTLTFDGERYGLPTVTARLTPEAARMLGRLLTAVCDAQDVPADAPPTWSEQPPRRFDAAYVGPSTSDVLRVETSAPESPFVFGETPPIDDPATAAAILRARAGWRSTGPTSVISTAGDDPDAAARHAQCMASLREVYPSQDGGPELISAAEMFHAVEVTVSAGPRFSDPRVMLVDATGCVFVGEGATLREAATALRPVPALTYTPIEPSEATGWTRTEPMPDPPLRVTIEMGGALKWRFEGPGSAQLVEAGGAAVVVVTPRRPDGTEADPGAALARASGPT
jgi:hypothetical protein